jgi:hypothetical protein
VRVLERGEHARGPVRAGGRAPAHREAWERWVAGVRRRLTSAAGRRAAPTRRRARRTARTATSWCWPAGARPYAPLLPAPGGERLGCVDGDRRTRGGARTRAGGRLGRRLGGSRRRRGAGRRRTRGHAGLCGAMPGRCAAPVPAQPVSRAPRRARRRECHHAELARRRGRLVLRPCSPGRCAAAPAAADRGARARPRSPRMRCGRAGRAAGMRASPATCSAALARGAVLEGVTAVRDAREEVRRRLDRERAPRPPPVGPGGEGRATAPTPRADGGGPPSRRRSRGCPRCCR